MSCRISCSCWFSCSAVWWKLDVFHVFFHWRWGFSVIMCFVLNGIPKFVFIVEDCIDNHWGSALKQQQVASFSGLLWWDLCAFVKQLFIWRPGYGHFCLLSSLTFEGIEGALSRSLDSTTAFSVSSQPLIGPSENGGRWEVHLRISIVNYISNPRGLNLFFCHPRGEKSAVEPFWQASVVTRNRSSLPVSRWGYFSGGQKPN